MFKLDDNLLRELGLGALPPAEKNKMLAHIYETLEMRVGMKLAEKMTNQQLDEFEAFIDKNDEAGALRWLESNFPNYKQVVADELEALKIEIRQAAPQILAASQQAAQQAAQMPAPQPQVQAAPSFQPAAPLQPSPYQQPAQPSYQEMPQPGMQPVAYPGYGYQAQPPAQQPYPPQYPPAPQQPSAAPTQPPFQADEPPYQQAA